jgi:cellulose synthase/poly-beta-1,6-N-acetylglucosamine synthase-like glycosyltransferase
MKTTVEIISYILFGYVAISVLYQFILAIASKKNQVKPTGTNNIFHKILVLVPAYKEDSVILRSTRANIKVRYPETHFDLVVMNDGLEDSTKIELQALGAHVLDVKFKKSTKVKSIKSAIERIDFFKYNGVAILDADNIMDPDFLRVSNNALCNGTLAMQGKRSAANLNGTTAVFDAIAEIANHAMVCKGANFFKLSSKLSGSGMVFNKELFDKTIMQSNAVGGFDKELELLLTQEKVFIEYNEDAIVYDDKTTSYDAFAKQRSRWLEAQYNFFRLFLISGIKSVFTNNLDHTHKVLQLALPPRALMVVFLLITSVAGVVIQNDFLIYASLVMMALNILSYTILIPKSWLFKYGPGLLIDFPKLIFASLKALFMMPKAAKEFIHTPHNNYS